MVLLGAKWGVACLGMGRGVVYLCTFSCPLFLFWLPRKALAL